MMNSEVSFIEERTKYISNDKEKCTKIVADVLKAISLESCI